METMNFIITDKFLIKQMRLWLFNPNKNSKCPFITIRNKFALREENRFPKDLDLRLYKNIEYINNALYRPNTELCLSLCFFMFGNRKHEDYMKCPCYIYPLDQIIKMVGNYV